MRPILIRSPNSSGCWWTGWPLTKVPVRESRSRTQRRPLSSKITAWALETAWRRALRDRFGQRWFEAEAAGGWLRDLWSQGQRLDAAGLLSETLGEELDLGVLESEFAPASP